MLRSRAAFLFFVVSLVNPVMAFPATPVTVKEDGQKITLENDFLQRSLEVRDESVRTLQLWNKLSGRACPMRGDEFEVKLTYERIGYEFGSENPLTLTTREFRVTGHSAENIEGGKRLVFRLTLRQSPQASTGLEGTLVYELKQDDFYTRQWLTLKPTGRGTFFIDSLAPAKFECDLPGLRLGGFGQPLLGEDLFLGLEYPTSLNVNEGSRITLGSYVGTPVSPEGFTSEPAVIGVSTEEGAHAAFMNYVGRMRAAPERLFVMYNTWYDIQGTTMNRENTLERVRMFKRFLLEPYGLHLDSFVLDDAWDDPATGLWVIDPKRFPNGFRELVEALKGIDSHLGLWFGPIGGYGGGPAIKRELRIAAGARQGMEVTSNGEYLCLAGRNYSRYFRERLLTVEREDGVNYFKLDGIPFGCNDTNHGHPVGIYSREADARVFVEILRALRAQNPQVFLNITTSIWLSPWWLKYADTAWMGGADTGYYESVPAMTRRQSAMTYRDAVFYNDFRRHEAQFPMSSLMTHGVIKGRYNMLGGENESLDDWKDAVVNALSVGTMLIKLYPSPDLLKPEEWDALGRSLQWAKNSVHPLLDNSTFVLGDPGQREPYGFLHYSPGKTILTLRNPFVRPAPVRLKLNEESGFQRTDHAWVAETVFPFRETLPGVFRHGDTLNTELEAYEQRVIEFRSTRQGEARLTGVRYSVQPAAKEEVRFRLYGAEGATETVRLSGPSAYLEAHLDGEKLELNPDGEAASLTVHFGKKMAREEQPGFSAPSLKFDGAAGGPRTLQITNTVRLPLDFKESSLALLLEPAEEVKGITARATADGHPAKVSVENGGGGLWYWFTSTLKPGNQAFEFEIQLPAEAKGAMHISGWILAKRILAARNLRLTFKPGSKLAPPPENLLPASSEVERKTYAVFERTLP